jgi:hypothetical protein
MPVEMLKISLKRKKFLKKDRNSGKKQEILIFAKNRKCDKSGIFLQKFFR